MKTLQELRLDLSTLDEDIHIFKSKKMFDNIHNFIMQCLWRMTRKSFDEFRFDLHVPS